MFFAAMEEEVQFNLKIISDAQITDDFKDKLLNKIRSNQYVMSYWNDMIDEAEEHDASTALDMIIMLWIKIRGYQE